jgi:hypothetical protein
MWKGRMRRDVDGADASRCGWGGCVAMWKGRMRRDVEGADASRCGWGHGMWHGEGGGGLLERGRVALRTGCGHDAAGSWAAPVLEATEVPVPHATQSDALKARLAENHLSRLEAQQRTAGPASGSSPIRVLRGGANEALTRGQKALKAVQPPCRDTTSSCFRNRTALLSRRLKEASQKRGTRESQRMAPGTNYSQMSVDGMEVIPRREHRFLLNQAA